MVVAVSSVPHAKAKLGHEIPAVRSGGYTYAGPRPAPVQIVVEDARKADAPFAPNRIGWFSNFELTFAQGGTDPLVFLGESVARELTKHGIPASVKPEGGAEVMTLRVEDFYIQRRFTTGWAPTTTLTHLRIVATYKGQSHVVSGFAIHARVIQSRSDKKGDWTYLFTQPLHLVVREAAAKLNRSFWNLSVVDATVDRMIATVPQRAPSTVVDRLADLACTNNERAGAYLGTLIADPNQRMRRTALWGLGVVGSSSAVPLLQQAAMEGDAGDLLLAVKSLADIGTPEARGVIREIEAAKRPTMSDRGVAWLDAILNLYR